eukprot:223352_1
MRSRSLINCLSAFKQSNSRYHGITTIISHRYQSTNTDHTVNNEEPNILQSDESILGELIELSEEELTKISDANGATIIDGIEYLQPSDFFYAKMFPVKTTQFLLDWAHDYMPYWFIVLTVPWLTKAVIIMPSIIYQSRRYESLAHLMPKALQDFAYLQNKKKAGEKSKNAKYYGEIQKDYNERYKELRAKYGFNPYTQQFRQMIPMTLQIPVHLSLFVATRTMYPTYPDWKQGGMLWFHDLSIGDPFYVWPAIAACTMIVSGWNMARNLEMQEKFAHLPMKAILYATSAVALCFIPLGGMLPVGLNIYIASNIISYMVQISLLDNRGFRGMVGLRPKSYIQGLDKEIQKTNRDLKHIVNSGATTAVDTEIKGKRVATGKIGRKTRVKTVTKMK